MCLFYLPDLPSNGERMVTMKFRSYYMSVLGLAVFLMLLSDNSKAADRYIYADVRSSAARETGSRANPYRTITRAISAAASGVLEVAQI